MASNHTPGPFTFEAGGKRGAWIKGSNGHWLCLSCGETDEEAAANTAFIVRAANNFEAVLSELKEIVSFVQTEGALRDVEIDHIRHVIDQAEGK